MSNESRIKNPGTGIIESVFFLSGKFELKITLIEAVFLLSYENARYLFTFYNFFEFSLYSCCGNVCHDAVSTLLFWVTLVNALR